MRLSRLLLSLAVLLSPAPALASGIDGALNAVMQPLADATGSVMFYKAEVMGQKVPLIIVWLMAAGVFTTLYFRFINVRLLALVFGLLRGGRHSGEGAGQISNWGALSTSLSSTVGLGNIAGVAVAVSVGGPGATVWMIVMGLLGMSTKFAECALGVKYRTIDKDGDVSGGPMYYIARGFADRGRPLLGRALAVFFALCCIGGAFGGGNMFQANQSYQMYMRLAGEGSFFADKGWLFGLGLAALTGAVIVGGIRRIAHASEAIFPAMAGLYIAACLGIIGVNIENLPEAFGHILRGAFGLDAFGGGMLGAMVAGVQRATFSNEAGTGSAAITYAAVKSDSHIAQGLIAMLNPFIDTVVICTMTALAIAVTGVYEAGQGVEGIQLTARAFATMGGWAEYWLGLTVFLFAYSTLIAWYYLGEKAFTYLAGKSRGKILGFKLAYCLCVVVGSAADLAPVVDFTDALFFAMAIPNVITLYVMAPEIRKDLLSYLSGIRTEKAVRQEKGGLFTDS